MAESDHQFPSVTDQISNKRVGSKDWQLLVLLAQSAAKEIQLYLKNFEMLPKEQQVAVFDGMITRAMKECKLCIIILVRVQKKLIQACSLRRKLHIAAIGNLTPAKIADVVKAKQAWL